MLRVLLCPVQIQDRGRGAGNDRRDVNDDFVSTGIQISHQILLIHIDDTTHKEIDADLKDLLPADLLWDLAGSWPFPPEEA